MVYEPQKSLTASCCASSFPSPTIQRELNRQGPDVGTSYRSAIFYVNDDQKRIANTYIPQLDTAKVFPARIVTEVMPLKGFYRAEDYHQDYALHHPDNPYIQVCDRPKIESLKRQFPELFVEYKRAALKQAEQRLTAGARRCGCPLQPDRTGQREDDYQRSSVKTCGGRAVLP